MGRKACFLPTLSRLYSIISLDFFSFALLWIIIFLLLHSSPLTFLVVVVIVVIVRMCVT